MFDRPEDHRSLQSQLEQFIELWHGYRKPWYGISEERLAATRLPDPLRWIYGYAGAWDGLNYSDTLFGNQDCLVNFEELYARDGKLVFAHENQGVWCVGTEPVGADPPVWAHLDGHGWKRLDDSLMHFLTTLILHETVFGCQHVESHEDAYAALSAAGFVIVPLWMNAPYPWCLMDMDFPPVSIHLANGCYLLMRDWVATNEPEPWKALPHIFKKKDLSAGAGLTLDPWDAIPDHLEIPKIVKLSHLRTVIRRHELEAEHHTRRAAVFRRMLRELESRDGE